MTTILVVMVLSMNGLAVPQYARSFGYPSQEQCKVGKRGVLLGSGKNMIGGQRVQAYCVPLFKNEEWVGLVGGKKEVRKVVYIDKKVTKKEKEKNRG